MIDNKLLNYDIDFSLSKDIKIEILKKYNILPIKKDTLYILAVTCDIEQDISPLLDIFKEPVKLIEISKESIEFVFKNFYFSQRLYEEAGRSLLSMDQQNEISLIEKFLDTLLEFCIDSSVSDIHIECL